MKAPESLGWLRCIPLQLVLAAVVVAMSGAQMFTNELRESVCGFLGITGALNAAKELYSLVSKCRKVFLSSYLSTSDAR